LSEQNQLVLVVRSLFSRRDAGTPSLYTLSFWLLSTSNFLFSASFSMMIPELPDYLTALGGREYIGLIIAFFTLTAGLSRPFSGKVTDTVGRVPVMAFGSIVCFVCGFLYPYLLTVWGFLILRLIHGFSTGTKPTATAAYVADVVPANRRGEAMGTLGLFTAMGMSLGPAIGSWLAHDFSMNIMFWTSSAFALLSIGILLRMPETLVNTQPFRFSLLKLGKDEIFDKQALPPFIVLLLQSVVVFYGLYPCFAGRTAGLQSHVGPLRPGAGAYFFDSLAGRVDGVADCGPDTHHFLDRSVTLRLCQRHELAYGAGLDGRPGRRSDTGPGYGYHVHCPRSGHWAGCARVGLAAQPHCGRCGHNGFVCHVGGAGAGRYRVPDHLWPTRKTTATDNCLTLVWWAFCLTG
jgi:MFS family permease